MKYFFFIICVPYFLYGQNSTLDMQTYLSVLKKHDIEYQKVLKDLDQLTFNKDLNMPSRQYLLEIQNEYGIVLGDGQTTKTFGSSLSKEFHETGTQASVFYSKNQQIGLDENTSGIRIEQSLLKNAFGGTTRKQSDIVDIENQILFLQVIQAYEDYIETKMQAFIDLQKSYLTLQATEDLYTQNKKIKNNTIQKRKNNIALDVDVDRINLQSLTLEEELLAAQTDADQKTQAISSMIGQPIDIRHGFTPWSVQLPEQINMDTYIDHSRTIEIIDLQKKALTQTASINKRNRYPELNLIFGLTRDEFTRFNVSADRNEALIGFNVSAPLGNSLAKAQEKSAMLAASIAHINKELAQRDLKINIETLVSQIRHQEKIHLLAEKKQIVAKRIVDQEQKRYSRGQIDLELWIDAQNELADNTRQAIEASIELSSMVLQWKNVTDQLVQKDDVKFE